MSHAHAALRIAEECLCIRIRQASRLVSRLYDAEIRDLGLQSSQISVLVAVARFGEAGAKSGRLADVLGMDRTTMTRNLRPLEKAGLLRVTRSPDDARVRVVLLTRAGERTIETVLPRWERAQKKLRAVLGAATTEALTSTLDRVTSAVDEATNRA